MNNYDQVRFTILQEFKSTLPKSLLIFTIIIIPQIKSSQLLTKGIGIIKDKMHGSTLIFVYVTKSKQQV